jgi:hypothetical protein
VQHEERDAEDPEGVFGAQLAVLDVDVERIPTAVMKATPTTRSPGEGCSDACTNDDGIPTSGEA